MESVFESQFPLWARKTVELFLLSIVRPLDLEKIIWRSLDITALPSKSGLHLMALLCIDGNECRIELDDTEIAESRYQNDDWQRRRREMVRLLVLEALKIELPWGILTGIRPCKLYHKMRHKGFVQREIMEQMEKVQLLSRAKFELLSEVGEAQIPFISPVPKGIGLYIGIPFCPTRCRYCSFASRPLHNHGHLVAGFLQALADEIRYFAGFCREMGWTVESVYIGGGTPTALTPGELDLILREIMGFPLKDSLEYTVEAGRPETILPAHLDVFRRWGVNRISVNPQTMHDKTLTRIGRAHSVDDVFRAVERVRKSEIPVLNMDLIAGLPGETVEDMDLSLHEVLKIAPENITLHTLAPKRAAEWRGEDFSDVLPEVELADWLNTASDWIRTGGWRPYYLYRQRRIMANQENIGYALPGYESLYNIWIMEECRTILGLGGGAVTKWVDSATGFIDRRSNPKCPATFTQRALTEMAEKAKWLKGYLN